jgi:UDP-N-acetyl-D-glucosamine dehydrogenase
MRPLYSDRSLLSDVEGAGVWVATRFIELAGEVNSAMPGYVMQKVADALNAHGKPLKGSKVLVLGVAYKRDTDDIRESPALEIIEDLLARGARPDYSDPYFPRLPAGRRHSIEMASVSLTRESLSTYDAVVLITDHTDWPYGLVHESARLIVDSRNAFRGRGLVGAHIVQA